MPAESDASLLSGDEVAVRVSPKQLALVGGISAEELLAQFVRDTHRLLAHMDEAYRMAAVQKSSTGVSHGRGRGGHGGHGKEGVEDGRADVVEVRLKGVEEGV